MGLINKLPDWFDGKIYDNGDTVKNPFSGEEFELTTEELSMYDFIVGSQLVFEMMPGNIPEAGIKHFKLALDWFKENNLEAYKILLD